MQSYGKKTILTITITNLTQYRLDLEQRTTISQLIWGPKIEKMSFLCNTGRLTDKSSTKFQNADKMFTQNIYQATFFFILKNVMYNFV